MYPETRDIFFTVCLIVILILYIKVLKGKRIIKYIMMFILMAMALGLYEFLLNVPIENLFFGFSTPEGTIHYSMPDAKVLKVIPYKNDAVAYCNEGKGVYFQVLKHGKKGWEIFSPNESSNGNNTFAATIKGISVETKKLPDYTVSFVLTDCFEWENPSNNVGLETISTISDTNNSDFESFQDNETTSKDYYYYTFTDISSTNYALIINGEVYNLVEFFKTNPLNRQ